MPTVRQSEFGGPGVLTAVSVDRQNRSTGVLADGDAALPRAVLTAWRALVETETAEVRPGQHALVQGAPDGVGHLAVQIARAKGHR